MVVKNVVWRGGGGENIVPEDQTGMRCVVINMKKLWLVVGMWWVYV